MNLRVFFPKICNLTPPSIRYESTRLSFSSNISLFTLLSFPPSVFLPCSHLPCTIAISISISNSSINWTSNSISNSINNWNSSDIRDRIVIQLLIIIQLLIVTRLLIIIRDRTVIRHLIVIRLLITTSDGIIIRLLIVIWLLIIIQHRSLDPGNEGHIYLRNEWP